MNTHLSSRQVGFMAFCLLLGTAVTYMPENSAGRDAWICTLLAIPVGVSILALVIGVQKMISCPSALPPPLFPQKITS
jgi:hypothetical protein